MSRRQQAVKRHVPADPKFGSTTVTKFINSLMLDGKKPTAEGIFYDAMRIVEEKTGQPGVNVFKQALNNVKPVIEVKTRRVGGATYQVPVEVRPERRNALAQKWIITFARSRGDKTMAERLAERWPALTVGLVHGRMKPEERDEVMRRFRENEIRVLVARTVIEVGIDVPNATTMVVEHPERFGLAQLHQLRGRVGRGGSDSYCVLMTGEEVPERLRAFAETEDGFRIAELDLAERGMGDLIGARQSGGFEVRHARLPEDEDLLARTRVLADEIIAIDPVLVGSEHQRLRERVLSRYPRAVEFFRTG